MSLLHLPVWLRRYLTGREPLLEAFRGRPESSLMDAFREQAAAPQAAPPQGTWTTGGGIKPPGFEVVGTVAPLETSQQVYDQAARVNKADHDAYRLRMEKLHAEQVRRRVEAEANVRPKGSRAVDLRPYGGQESMGDVETSLRRQGLYAAVDRASGTGEEPEEKHTWEVEDLEGDQIPVQAETATVVGGSLCFHTKGRTIIGFAPSYWCSFRRVDP